MRAFWCLLLLYRVGNANEIDSCNSKEICAYKGKEKNCRCDRDCVEFNDCCIDALRRGARSLEKEYVCRELCPLGGIFVVGSCQAGWSGNDRIRAECESASSVSDSSFSHIPAVNTRTGTLYKNYQCAICNNVKDHFIKFWTIAIQCYAWNETAYAADSYLVQSSAENFRCLAVHSPSAFHALRSCYPDVLEDCPDTGNNTLVDFCRNHVALKTSTANVTYRNEYCALCNGIPESDLSCTVPRKPYPPWQPSPFTSLEEHDCPRGTARHLFLPHAFSVKCKTKFFYYFSRQYTFLNFIYNRFIHFYYTRIKWFDIVLKVKQNSTYIFCEHGEEVFEGNRTVELTYKKATGVGKLYCSKVKLAAGDEILTTDLGVTLTSKNWTFARTGYILTIALNGDFVISSAAFQDLVRPVPFMIYLCFATFLLKIYLFVWFILFVTSFGIHSQSKSTFDYCTLCLVVTYMALNLLAVVGDPLYVNRATCYHLGLCMYFTYMAYLLWLNVLGFDLMRTISTATATLQLPAEVMNWRKFLWYFLYAHGIPGFLIVLIVCLDRYLPSDAKYKPHFGVKRCWLGTVHSRMAFSLIPFACVAALTIPFFIIITNMIIQNSRSRRGLALLKKGFLRRRVLLFAKISCLVAVSKLLVMIADQFDESDHVFYVKILLRFGDMVVGLVMLHFIGNRNLRALRWRLTGKIYRGDSQD